jgi:predicted transcriptional regulator
MASLLETTHLGQLIFDKKELYQVFTNTKVEEAARFMKEKKILAVPVFDREKNQYVGILDMFDIMRFTTVGFFEESVFNDSFFSDFQFGIEEVGQIVEKSSRSRRIVVSE